MLKYLKNIVKTPVIPEGFYSSWAQFTIQWESKEIRDQLQADLKVLGIPTMVYYPKPMHEQTAFKNLNRYVECPVTERLCEHVLALPMHPYFSEGDVKNICTNIIEYLNK